MSHNYLKHILSLVMLASIIIFSGCGGGGSSGGSSSGTSNTTIQMGGSRQGQALNLSGTVSTFAGWASTLRDGTGDASRFLNPFAAVAVGANLYVADTDNHAIRKIVIATGEVTTLAGSRAIGEADGTGVAATFNTPRGITSDGSNLYVADTFNHKIRKIAISTGEVTTLAGSGALAIGATDGTGTAATFNNPAGITTDGSNLYVADMGNQKIRKIVISTGVVSSLTGSANTASAAGATDGAGATATFNYPYGITSDGSNLYVADTGNNKIRKVVIATAAVSSLTGAANTAGTAGAADGAGAAATFFSPNGITTDGTYLYVADMLNHKIRVIAITSGTVSSLTGAANTAGTMGAADGVGTAATFKGPQGITTDGTYLYVTDTGNRKIRKIALATGVVSSLAGTQSTLLDGTGAAATFKNPAGITTDGSNLYVADTDNHAIRKIVIATGVVTTLAGSGAAGAADGTGTAATFNYPVGITTDGSNLYVADTVNRKIRKIVIATGEVSSLTGTANTASTSGAADGAGAAATFNNPAGITTDGSNLYVADEGNHKIRKIVIATGEVSSLTGVANTAGTIGAADGAGSAATFYSPYGITTDGSNLYVVDAANNKIRKIVIATRVVSSLTGVANTAGPAGAMDGTGTAATFSLPLGITTDGSNLYVADRFNSKIRKIVIVTGEVSSLTGTANTASTSGAADGAASAATFSMPGDITTDGSKLYVVDSTNSTIRKIE